MNRETKQVLWSVAVGIAIGLPLGAAFKSLWDHYDVPMT